MKHLLNSTHAHRQLVHSAQLWRRVQASCCLSQHSSHSLDREFSLWPTSFLRRALQYACQCIVYSLPRTLEPHSNISDGEILIIECSNHRDLSVSESATSAHFQVLRASVLALLGIAQSLLTAPSLNGGMELTRTAKIGEDDHHVLYCFARNKCANVFSIISTQQCGRTCRTDRSYIQSSRWGRRIHGRFRV